MRVAREEMGLPGPGANTPDIPERAPPPSTQPEVWLELFTLDPLMRLRVSQRVFRYDYLGARRMPNVRGNFKLLASDILKFAPQAARIHQAALAASGAAVDQERFMMEEQAHELSLIALLTRESVMGLPR
jgi:hypothetical protein